MAFRGLSLDSKSGEQHAEAIAEINIIPLVDVLLVLLIIFMVAAPLSMQGIKVELPRSRAKSPISDEKKIVLSINSKGEYFLDKDRIAKDKLEEKLKAVFQYREQKDIYIRADRDVPYGAVVDGISSAKLVGVQKVSMLTVPPQAK